MRPLPRTINLLILLVALLLPAGATLCAETHVIVEPLMPGPAVDIWNGGNKSIVFYVSIDGKNWAKFSLASGKDQIISIDGSDGHATVAIRTGSVINKRIVHVQNRYRIFFNGSTHSWDLATMRAN